MDGDVEQFSSETAVTAETTCRIRLSLIGDFRAETPDGQSLLPISRKARALLCIIGMARPQGALRAVAGALLWTSKHRDAVANSLRQALGELQPLLSACGRPYVLATKRGRLVLDPDSVWIDVLDMTPEQAAAINNTDPSHALCRDLRGISPTFDAYLDRLWVEIGYRRALAPPIVAKPGTWRETLSSQFANQSSNHTTNHPSNRLTVDPSRLFGNPTVSGFNFEKLERFPQAFSDEADIPTHQLGWRMAVLPFRSLGSPVGRGIALGMAEEVSAALGRFRAPRIVATATFWDGTGPAADAMSRCRTYNLDYIIDGTIQVVENKVRVSVTLLDVVLDFEVIWSHRFDGSLDDLFTLQDRIASETVAQVDPELFQRRWATTSPPKTAIAQSHHALLAAIQGIFRLERSKFMRSRELLKHAIELDPDFAAPHAWLAYWSIIAVGHGWAEEPRDVIVKAGESAERALLLDPLDARGIAIAGHVKAYLLHDIRTALQLHAQAIELNPNLPIAWALSAFSKCYSGDHATALRHCHVAQALSPRDPHNFLVRNAQIAAHLFRHELDAAENLIEAQVDSQDSHTSAVVINLAVFGHLHRTPECERLLSLLLEKDPELNIERILARSPLQEVDRKYYAEGLALAGVPAQSPRIFLA